jgi:predicted GNAT superfamily acetyltransferase
MPDTITSQDLDALLELNNQYETEICKDTPESFQALIHDAVFARHINRKAFMVCLDQDSQITGENINWLQQNYGRFLYVDRIAVKPEAHGEGLGRKLYGALFDVARTQKHGVIYCEINAKPPNPGSVKFHEKIGFSAFGPPRELQSGKTVQYFQYRL